MYDKEKFKAFLVESNEKKGVMDVNLDTLDEGDVLIKVSYSSFNYKDGLAITGKTPILKKFPKKIPSRIAIIAVEIGLLLYPKSSIPIILLKP